MWSIAFLILYIFKHLFLPVIPSWTFIESGSYIGPLISCDSLTTEIATKVYSAGLEPIAMTFSYKTTSLPNRGSQCLFRNSSQNVK